MINNTNFIKAIQGTHHCSDDYWVHPKSMPQSVQPLLQFHTNITFLEKVITYYHHTNAMVTSWEECNIYDRTLDRETVVTTLLHPME